MIGVNRDKLMAYVKGWSCTNFQTAALCAQTAGFTALPTSSRVITAERIGVGVGWWRLTTPRTMAIRLGLWVWPSHLASTRRSHP